MRLGRYVLSASMRRRPRASSKDFTLPIPEKESGDKKKSSKRPPSSSLSRVMLARCCSSAWTLKTSLCRPLQWGPVPVLGPVPGCSSPRYPDPWADPTSRSTLGFRNLYHRSIGLHTTRQRVQVPNILGSGLNIHSGYGCWNPALHTPYLCSLDPHTNFEYLDPGGRFQTLPVETWSCGVPSGTRYGILL